MDYLTLAAFLWLSVFVLLGLWRGFWRSFAALASFVLAYAGSVFFAAPVSAFFVQVFAETNPSPTLFWLASAAALFILIGLFSRLLVLMLGRVLPLTGIVDKLGGALASGGYGALIAIFLIWSYAFVSENLHAARGQTVVAQPSQLVDFARRAVAELVSWNVRHGGGSEAAADLTAALTERPAEVLHNVRSTLNSPAMREVVNSAEIEDAVRTGDPERLQQSVAFQQLLNSPSVQDLRETLARSGVHWSDAEIAAYTVAFSHNIDSVRTDPEFVELYSDPEVQAFLDGEGQLTPSLMQKGQELLQIVSREIDLAEVQRASAGEPPQPAE